MKHCYSLVIVLLLVNSVATANEFTLSTLRMESAPFKDRPLYCENDIVGPNQNDFEIIHYELMSSEAGLRYVLMSVKNTSNGQRFLTEKDLIAIFANCEPREPHTFKQKFSGGEIITKTIYFGQSQFPIIKVVSKAEDI